MTPSMTLIDRLQQVIDDYTDSVRAAKETAMDERTPKAKQLVAMMKATMNLDLDELIQAGVIDDRDSQESSPWAKWNKDAPLFIAKLDDRRLNSLAALIAHKFPDAFARVWDETRDGPKCKNHMTDGFSGEPQIPCRGFKNSAGVVVDGCGEPCDFVMQRENGPASPDYRALLEMAVEALDPFVTEYQEWDFGSPDDLEIWVATEGHVATRSSLRLGHLRAAVTIVSEIKTALDTTNGK